MAQGTTSEIVFAERMEAEGWQVYKNGFPDFLCIKDKEVMLVEVKQGKTDKLKPHQVTMLTQLTRRKPKIFVWLADNKELIPLKDILRAGRRVIKANQSLINQNMKYDSNTKRERNAEIVFLHKLHPELALREIAVRYGISAQRVHQILARTARLLATACYDSTKTA